MTNVDQMKETATSTLTISKQPRFPEFNAADPELWFSIAERYFEALGLNDSRKQYLSVLSAIPTRYANEVRDILMQPLGEEPYKNLKENLVKRLSSSQDEKTRELLENVVMGDEKPSQFLRRLQALAGTAIPDNLLRTLWMRGLPEKIKPTMVTVQDKSITDMAEVADTVYGLLPPRSTVAETSKPPSAVMADVQQAVHVQQLRFEMAEIKKLLGEIYEGSNSRGRSRTPYRGRSQSRSRSRSESRGPRPTGMCWYHWNFAENAQKCTKPCSWTPENERGSR